MKKKEYKKPELQVVNITPCTLLTTSMGRGGNDDSGPEMEEDEWYYGE